MVLPACFPTQPVLLAKHAPSMRHACKLPTSLQQLPRCLMSAAALHAVQVLLQAGDVLLMSGEARYKWKHGIDSVHEVGAA